MKLIRVAAAAVNQTPLDWEGNQRRILAALTEARAHQATVVCLPELCISGYGCEDAFLSSGVPTTALEVLREIVPATRGLAVSLGLPLLVGGGLFNVACLAVDGRVAGFVGKQNLAGEGLHYEPRWFKPWPAGVRSEISLLGSRYPVGDLVFDLGGARLGFEICEDAWVAQRPGSSLAQLGVDLLLNPSASHFAFGKQEIRERFVLEGSRAFHLGYVYTNLLGNEAGRSIYDGGSMIAASGKMLAIGPRFSFADVQVTSATLDLDSIRMQRARSGLRPHLGPEDARIVAAPLVFPETTPLTTQPAPPDWENSSEPRFEEFARAVPLALCDYLRKSHSRGFVVSLSGGADSAAVSVLVSLMVHLGLAELGADSFRAKLGVNPPSGGGAIADIAETARQLTGELLTCVYQATKNSGPVTRSAAEQVADALGARYHEFQVQDLVDRYTQLVEQALGRPLTWAQDDLALQNIQARVRSPGVWMLTNVRGALLLSTSNRSEAAVGYATMDGDTSGGLAPIAGIDKAFLRRWLRWMETTGPAGSGPVPALAAVNQQQPTAELRPPAATQTDEADLMPYEVLDAIERLAIRDKRMPRECFELLEPQFPAYSSQQLAAWVERFFRLWCRNQWKRERYAPSFHLDDENLDPKTWCRFPILSGGYERELRELREFLARRAR